MKHWNKFKWKSKNHFNAQKLNSKYFKYFMMLISLNDIKPPKKIKIRYPVRSNIYLNHKKDNIFRVTYTFVGRLNKRLTWESVTDKQNFQSTYFVKCINNFAETFSFNKGDWQERNSFYISTWVLKIL